jgi:two-component system CheB/CheR fusion protein
MVLFAAHNITKDPAFSRLDLVTCRNLLIYLNRQAQVRVMETMHFALKPGGYLFLGSSESADTDENLFVPVDKDHRIYQSRPIAARLSIPVPDLSPAVMSQRFQVRNERSRTEEIRALERLSYTALHHRLLEQYAPPSIVVNGEYDIVHISERAGRYLQMAGGEPSKNLLNIARPELRLELRTALYQATQRGVPVTVSSISSSGR